MSNDFKQFEEVTILLSEDRLSTYFAICGNLEDAVDLHREALRLGGMLLAVIAIVEICLRNAICTNLHRHFGGDDWLTDPSQFVMWREAEKAQISKALAKVKQGRPSYLMTGHRERSEDRIHDVVAHRLIPELSFFLWKRMFGPDYEHMLWKPSLKYLFPQKSIQRAEVAQHLEVIHRARNRLAHHEPVLYRRFHATVGSLRFISRNLLLSPDGSATAMEFLMGQDFTSAIKVGRLLHKRFRSSRKSQQVQ